MIENSLYFMSIRDERKLEEVHPRPTTLPYTYTLQGYLAHKKPPPPGTLQ